MSCKLVVNASICRTINYLRYKISPTLVKTEEYGVYRVIDSIRLTNVSEHTFLNGSRSLIQLVSDGLANMINTRTNPFVLSESVRGMTCLDRSAFNLVVSVPGIKVPMKAVAPVSHRFKKLLLKVPKIKPIAELDEADQDKLTHKLVLFDPKKLDSAGDFSQVNKEFFTLNGVSIKSFQHYSLPLNYENWTYDEVLDAVLPKDSESVGGFSTVGHIAHLNLRDHLLEYKHLIGQVICDKLTSIRTVVNKMHTIDNTFRNFKMEVLAGDPDFVTVAREHGFAYKLDFSKVYWNSRLATEHQRLVDLVKPGDILYDVFAGIGPFAVPAAKKGCSVLANDLNPESYHWLRYNIDLNKVTGKVKSFNHDGREFIRNVIRPDLIEHWKTANQGFGLHVVMNLPALALEFLDEFVGLMEGLNSADAHLPMVHCYCFSRSDNPVTDVSERTATALGLSKFEELTERKVRIVRNVAPGKEMLCVSFRLSLSVLMTKTSEDNGWSFREIVESYFWDGYQYKTILKFLDEYHDIKISYRTLRRRLQEFGLYRRLQPSTLLDVWSAIQRELQGPGRLGGYRSMRRLIMSNYHLRVSNETVRLVLCQTDRVGVENRRCHRLRRRTYSSKGPNDTWHIDGYDKLRPYGILISGCIDGYSRKLLWLKCCYTNHNPNVIAGYYLECVSNVGGYPSRVRTDCGTENVTVAAIQSLVTGSDTSHIYGTSPGNQRIEAWWSFYRQHSSQWWIELFEGLIEFGAYHPSNFKHTECLRFCFMSLVQKELETVCHQWNTHRIRPSVGARCPPGIPDELYYLPHFPAADQLIVCANALPIEVFGEIEHPRTCNDSDFEDYLSYLCTVHNWLVPQNTDEAVNLYLNLLPYLQ